MVVPPEQPSTSLPHLRFALLRRGPEEYGADYQQHFLDQYKLFVEMADRISARRMQANTFFLGVNTGVLTIFAALAKDKILQGFFGALPIVALLILCFVWSRIVLSYRQLNSGKYKVVQEMERLLPAAPYAAEWVAMGEGHDPRLYLPLTHVEIWVPRMFGLLYVALMVAVLLSGAAPATARLG